MEILSVSRTSRKKSKNKRFKPKIKRNTTKKHYLSIDARKLENRKVALITDIYSRYSNKNN